MNKNSISIATISWARNAEEETLLRESLTQLASLNIPVFVADGGSTQSFIEFLKSFSHFTLVSPKGRGVWAQAKASVEAAFHSGTGFIFYTEPDKLDFFKTSILGVITEAAEDEQTGIVLASRSETGFATFPAFQQSTETTINNCCKEIAGKQVDYTYGPFILNRKLVPYFSHIKEDVGWGWRPYTFCIAHRLGLNISPFIADFACPLSQREDNAKERVYRMKQLMQNIQGIVLSTTVAI